MSSAEPRVLLTLASSTGGVGRHVASLAAGAVAAGVPVAVAGPEATDLEFGFARLGAVFFPVEIATAPRPLADARAVRALAAAVTRWRPDVVHAHGLRAGAVAVSAVRPLRLRARAVSPVLIVTWHNAVLGDGIRRRALTGLEMLVARGADLTLGASEDLVARAGSLGARRARLAPVAAPPLPPALRDPAAVRADLESGQRPLLLAVGRLAPQKDYPTLLTAARSWRDLEPRPLLAIVGDGPLRAELQARVDTEELPVRLLGPRDDLADLLGAADAFVLSSTWEARSLVVQEAMRAGVPVVATAVGGIPGLVSDAAVLVPPADPPALAAAVTRLLADPAAAKQLGAAGAAQADIWPDENRVQADALALYRGWRRPPAVGLG